MKIPIIDRKARRGPTHIPGTGAKHPVGHFLIAGSLLAMTGSAAADIYNGHDYLVVGQVGITWDAAKAAALPGYHLATISSAGENDFIKSLVNLPANGEEYWLGGSQPTGSATGDNWTWENGEGVFFNGGAPVGGAYVNWLTSTSEPSGDGDYVAMWADDNRFFGPGVAGFWNDEQVGVVPWISGYVLESIDPVPEPGTLGLLALGTLLFATRRRHAKA